jgi:hypothetical protein
LLLTVLPLFFLFSSMRPELPATTNFLVTYSFTSLIKSNKFGDVYRVYPALPGGSRH